MSTAYIMVNFNGGDELLKSVASLLNDLSADDQLIIIDNASKDESISRVRDSFPDVVIVENSVNNPFAAATNQGIRLALGSGYSYIGMINPDVRVQKGMTRLLINSLEKDSRTAAVSPLITFVKHPGRIWFAGGAILWPIGWTMHLNMKRSPEELGNSELDTQTLTGCCILARSETWKKVGLLDPAYAMYTEDVDWSHRVKQAGLNLKVNCEARLGHNVSSSSGGGRTPFKMKYRTLSNKLFFNRYTPTLLRPFQWAAGSVAALLYTIMLVRKQEVDSALSFASTWFSKFELPIPWPPDEKNN